MKIGSTPIEIVMNPYGLHSTIPGFGYRNNCRGVMVRGEWNDDIAAYMRKKGLFALYLNYSMGWKGGDVDFLNHATFLRVLNVISTPIDDIQTIGLLGELDSLSISCHWKSCVDLSGLTSLRHCFISWDKGADSVFRCDSLEYLAISDFKIKDYSGLSNLGGLKELSISNSSFFDLSTIGTMKGLKKLELINCRQLLSLDGIEMLDALEWLSIDGCRKITTIGNLSVMKNLRILQLRDTKDIDSLQPIRSLEKLEALSFYGDTSFVDGDLGVIEELANISVLGFTGRRHYTHKPITKYMNWDNLGTPVKVVERKN